MTTLSEDVLVKIVELMASVASLKAVADAAGISESCLYTWRAKCIADQKAGDVSSPFFLSFRDGEPPMWFTEAAARSRSEHLMSLESQIRAEAAGVEVPVRGPSQEPLYKLDPRFVGRSDDYVREAVGKMEWEELEPYDRLLKDENGLPIPETTKQHLPAQLRLRVLEAADPRYRAVSHQSVDVNVSGGIVHEVKPLARRPGEPRADLQELRALAALSPEERRAKFGGKAYPTDASGRRTIPALSPPLTKDAPDDQNLGKRPPPEPYTPPPRPAPVDTGAPSYVKPSPALDQSGRGAGNPPPGGMRIDNNPKGYVR